MRLNRRSIMPIATVGRVTGFTLIELLVVVAIIVVLLALLTPAMDRAIYQAELTVCGTDQRSAANGATLYATANGRRYPPRGGMVANANYFGQTLVLYNVDDRAALRGYINLNDSLYCPLIEGVDIESADRAIDGSIWGGLKLFFGWRYNGFGGMMKLGDRWTFAEPTYNVDIRSDLLVCDMDVQSDTQQVVYGSHSDSFGLMENAVWEGENEGGPLPGGLWGNVDRRTQSWWWNRFQGSTVRGEIDMNFAFADGSVKRVVQIPKLYKLPTAGVPTYEELGLTWAPEDSHPAGGRADGNLRQTVPLQR
jgi:prepilin-type N-terminal cleavage/methylation domain-containing protein/prepilin-type processing-associated H-X9-DG protein